MIGQAVVRREDLRLLRGEACFTDDLPLPEDGLVMAVVRSPVAAGRLVALDVTEAAAAEGVFAVLTGADYRADGLGGFATRLVLPGPDGGEMRQPPFLPLAIEAVRYVGEPIALVLASDRAAAEAAAERVVPEITEGPAVVDFATATAPGATRVWDSLPDNRCFRVEIGDRLAVEAAMAGAATVVRQRLRISRVSATPLEPRALRAAYDTASGVWRLDLGTQAPHRVAGDLAGALGVPVDRVRVVGRDCGGSFGMKNSGYPEYVLALWAARRTGKSVAWRASRLESFLADYHGRDQWAEAALALDGEGRFLALDVRVEANLGAHLAPSTVHPPVANLGGLAGVYRTPAIHVVAEGAFSNTHSTAPYRGAGRPEATYVIERMVDLAATMLGLDRAELRRRNLIRPEEMPFRTGLTLTYDGGDFPAVLDRALGEGDWAGFETRRAAAAARGMLRGIGIANPIEIAGGPAGGPLGEFARLTLAPGGSAVLAVGTSDSGQGHATAFGQLLADRLGLDPARVALAAPDTALMSKGTGTFGSRSLAAAGTAVVRVADAVVERLKATAADLLEVAAADLVFEAGAFRVAGTDRAAALPVVLASLGEAVVEEAFVGADGATFPNGCHVCEVEVDPDTGRVAIVAYLVVDDVGLVLNPLLVKGQIHGGVAQGAGQALAEAVVYEAESGQLVTASLMDYGLLRAADLPMLAVESHPVPTLANPLGVKGVGEAGTVGALPAVMSAVCDALAPLGVRHLDMPATPARVWRAISEARGAGGGAAK
jgi:aerobic carbon-monoxide dehydrogenase large subunit